MEKDAEGEDPSDGSIDRMDRHDRVRESKMGQVVHPFRPVRRPRRLWLLPIVVLFVLGGRPALFVAVNNVLMSRTLQYL